MLRAWLPLNGDLHNQGLSSYNSTSTNYTVINQGKIGKCIKCTNSINTGIPANGWDFTTTSISFGAWIKINKAELETKTSAATYSSIYTSCGGTLLGNHNYGGFGLRWATNNIQSSGSLTDVYIYANMRNKNRDTVKTSNYTVPFDTWTHVIVIFNREKGTLSLYINGTLFQTESSPIVTYGTTGNISQGDFYICQASWDSGKGNTMAGPWQLNDVRIYDHALSAKEVEEIAKGLVLHYPLNNNGLGNENLINNSMFSNLSTSGNVIKDTTKLFNGMSTCKISKTGATSNTYLGWTSQNLVSQLTPGEKITVSVWVYRESNHGIDAGCEWRMYQEYKDNGTRKTDWTGFYNSSSWTIGQWVRFSHTYTIRENITGVYFNLDVIKNGTYWIAQPKVERGSLVTNWCPSSFELNLPTNIIYDSSGYNNNGTIVGSLETTTPSPRYSCATKFDGDSTAIQTPNLTTMITDKNYTISCWTYKTSIGTKNYQTIYGGPSGFELEARSSSSTNPLFRIHNWGGGTTAYEFGKWYHFCFVHNDNESKLYINGELKITGTSVAIPSGNYFIGAWSTSTKQNYDGNMSDFRIYATALTAEQVADLYRTSMTIDNQGNIHARELVEL